MNTFNYRGLTFAENKGDNFHLLTASFLDYHKQFIDISITWSQIGRKNVWVSRFSNVTTEYIGEIEEVLEKTHKYFLDNSYEEPVKAKEIPQFKGTLEQLNKLTK